jgi:hypothetical protein
MSREYTLNDKMIQNGLSAVSKNYRDGTFLAGGIALQMHAFNYYSELLRPTNDADFTVMPSFKGSTFGEYYAKLEEYLEYEHEKGRDREGFFVQLKKNERPFILHFQKPTEKHWEKIKKIREMEYETSDKIYIPNTEDALHVLRAEGIFSTKLRRVGYLNENGLLSDDLTPLYKLAKYRKLEKLAEQEFPSWLKTLENKRNSLSGYFEAGVQHGTNARLVYNGEKDLYDLSLLAKMVVKKKIEFDEKHYEQTLVTVE